MDPFSDLYPEAREEIKTMLDTFGYGEKSELADVIDDTFILGALAGPTVIISAPLTVPADAAVAVGAVVVGEVLTEYN